MLRTVGVTALAAIVISTVLTLPAQVAHATLTWVDSGFNPIANAEVKAIAVASDGKVIIGGNFTCIGTQEATCESGQSRNRIARLNADGTLDATFNPGTDGVVNAIAVVSDGKIIIGGSFTNVGGLSRTNIARLNVDGAVDTTFNPGTNGAVNAIAIASDGKIIIGGDFENAAGSPRDNIARLNVDGTVDTTFNPGTNGAVNAIAIASDGKIIIGGAFGNVGGEIQFYVARLNTNGSLDITLNPGPNGPIYALAIDSSGKILIGGDFGQIGTGPEPIAQANLARLNAAGTLDTTFRPELNGSVLSIGISGTKVLIGGWFYSVNSESRYFLAQLNNNATIDSAFNPGANYPVLAITMQSDGKALLGGQFLGVGSDFRRHIARLNAEPSYIPYFDTPIPTSNGFTVNVTNYDASYDWAASVTTGTVTLGTPEASRLPLTVTGLADASTATVTVTTSRAGYGNGVDSATGESAPPPCSVSMFAGGAGTSVSPFRISSQAHLEMLSANWTCRDPGIHFLQTTNIALTGVWEPIGDSDRPFQGSFDGDGKTISNVFIDDALGDTGLFGYTSGATITGVNLTAVSIDSPRLYIDNIMRIGGIIGTAHQTEVSDCSSAGSIDAYQSGGGLVGSLIDSTLSDCTVVGTVGTTSESAFEIGGAVGTSTRSTISDVQSDATVVLNGFSGRYGGGLIGRATDTSISNAIATGPVTGSTYLGGLVGRFETASLEPDEFVGITDSHATGNVTGDGTDSGSTSVGGLVGSVESESNAPDQGGLVRITGSSARGAVEGYSQIGGFIGSVTFLQSYYAPEFFGITILDSSATGSVTGQSRAGGFIGELMTSSDAEEPVTVNVSRNSARGDVRGTDLVGGFIGRIEEASITDSYATGSVVGNRAVGGFIGIAVKNVNVTRTRASGNVTGTEDVGGLLGVQGNFEDAPAPGSLVHITESLATGSVSSGSGSVAGGLVGLMFEDVSITNSYATGGVTGHSYVGGLVGGFLGISPRVTTSYGSGSLTATSAPANVGGAIGGRAAGVDGSFDAAYWNSDTTGSLFGIGSSSGGVDQVGLSALTSLQMRSSANFVGWNFATVWGYDCSLGSQPVLRWAYPSATATSCLSTNPDPPVPGPQSAIAGANPATPAINRPITQAPGTSGMRINGQEEPVSTKRGVRGGGLTLRAGPLEFTLRSQTARGQRVPLAPDGSLILARSGEVPVSGDGLEPNSSVSMTLFSDPITLGSASVVANGSFQSSPVIPSTAPLGAHTLQLTGRTKTGEPFELSIGVLVATPAAAVGANPVISVQPKVVKPGASVVVVARGVQAGCRVVFTIAGEQERTMASKKGIAQAHVMMPKRLPKNLVVKATLGGAKCSSVTVSKSISTKK